MRWHLRHLVLLVFFRILEAIHFWEVASPLCCGQRFTGLVGLGWIWQILVLGTSEPGYVWSWRMDWKIWWRQQSTPTWPEEWPKHWIVFFNISSYCTLLFRNIKTITSLSTSHIDQLVFCRERHNGHQGFEKVCDAPTHLSLTPPSYITRNILYE